MAYFARALIDDVGAGIHARSLVSAWRKAGHEVLTLPALEEGPPLSSPPHSSGVATARIAAAFPAGQRGLVRHLRGTWRLWTELPATQRRLHAFRADVLVGRRGMYDYTLDALVQEANVPVIAETNGVLSLELTDIAGDPPLWREREHERKYLLSSTAISANTQETAQLVSGLGVCRDNIHVVGNGVDTELFHPNAPIAASLSTWRSNFDCVVAFCGSGSYTMDRNCLFDALDKVFRENERVGFLFIGIDQSSIPSHINVDAEVVPRCLAVGKIPHMAMPDYLAAADICWAAYRNTYGSPLKQFEYMAMGKPMAIAGAGEAVRLVSASLCGHWAGLGDSEGLAASLSYLIQMDTESRQAMGISGRKWVEANATWSVVASSMLHLI